jgi:hypothetical protein
MSRHRSQRLTDFVSVHLVAHVFGTHIEQKNLPYLDFGRGTIYQIDEAPLELWISERLLGDIEGAGCGKKASKTLYGL